MTLEDYTPRLFHIRDSTRLWVAPQPTRGAPTADGSVMSLRLVALALTTSLLLGCFVLDELDAAENLMEKPGFSSEQKKKPGPPEQPQAVRDTGNADRVPVSDWWKKARSLTSGEVDDGIVRCELGGATQFMRRPDCLARGGTPRPAGG